MCDFSPTVVSKRIMILFTPVMLLSFDQNFAKSKPNPTPMDQQKPPKKNPKKKNGFPSRPWPSKPEPALDSMLWEPWAKSGELKELLGSWNSLHSLHFPCPEV